MEKRQILSVLQCPSAPLVDMLISSANLTYKESLAVDLCGRKGMTQEQAAEEAERRGLLPSCSVDSMQKWNRSGMRKLDAAWSGNWIVSKISQ